MPSTFPPVSPNKTRTDMGFIINAVHVIDPSECEITSQSISASDAGRDELGTMHPMIIGRKRTVKLAWNMIDPANAVAIFNAVTSSQTFLATVTDLQTCEVVSSTFYVGDISAPMQMWNATRLDGKMFSKLSFTLIEV